MSATNGDAGILLDAVDALQKVRELLYALYMSGSGIISGTSDERNAIIYLADLARDRLDEAEQMIDRVRKGFKPTRAAS